MSDDEASKGGERVVEGPVDVEPDAIRTGPVAWSLLVSTAVIVACVVAVRAAYPERPGVTGLSPGPLELPEPRLQLDDERDMRDLRAREDAWLRGGDGRPSIEQAMARVLAQEGRAP